MMTHSFSVPGRRTELHLGARMDTESFTWTQHVQLNCFRLGRGTGTNRRCVPYRAQVEDCIGQRKR